MHKGFDEPGSWQTMTLTLCMLYSRQTMCTWATNMAPTRAQGGTAGKCRDRGR